MCIRRQDETARDSLLGAHLACKEDVFGGGGGSGYHGVVCSQEIVEAFVYFVMYD